MKTLLKISNLSINFQVRKTEFEAVKNLNLTIEENQVAGLVGESGSGKSVTTKLILGLLNQQNVTKKGRIIFNNQDILNLSQKEFKKIFNCLSFSILSGCQRSNFLL